MSLIEKADKMMSYPHLEQSAMEAYVEALCFASKSDIIKLLEYADEKYGMQFSFWARLLAFRMALLQSPNDPDLLEWTGSMLLTYGAPDYDETANEYLSRAKKLKNEKKT